MIEPKTQRADVRPREHLRAVDGARGIAVLAVVMHHAYIHARIEPASFLPHWGNCGARGVDLFFVISGFCLALPFIDGRTPGPQSLSTYRQFLIRRFSRIAPPYYAALALFFALSFTSFGVPGAGPVNPRSATTLAELAHEAAFLTSQAPLHNVSFWTLGIEMRWYLLCPLLLELFRRSERAFLASGAIFYVLYLGTPYGVADEGTLPCFMLGICAAQLIVHASPFVRFAKVAAPVVLGIAIWTQSHSALVDHGDPLWHVACVLVLIAIVGTSARTPFTFAPLRFIGTASYSIYLVNWPSTAWLEAHGAPPLVAALAALALGIVFWALAERTFMRPRLRASLERFLKAAARPSTQNAIVRAAEANGP